MAESLVQVTEGTGKKLHTNSRVIGVNTVEDEYVIPGEYALASYILQATNVSIATATDHLLQIMAGATLNVRIRRIEIVQATSATAAALATFDILRLTTAGTGGTAVTAAKYDNADNPAGATGITIPGVKGTESTVLYRDRLSMRQTQPVSPSQDPMATWIPSANAKGILIPAGAANGLVVKNISAIAAATVDILIEFVETSFV